MEKMHMNEIIIVYGLTESSPGMTATRTTDPAEIRATTVGRALPFVEVSVRTLKPVRNVRRTSRANSAAGDTT